MMSITFMLILCGEAIERLKGMVKHAIEIRFRALHPSGVLET